MKQVSIEFLNILYENLIVYVVKFLHGNILLSTFKINKSVTERTSYIYTITFISLDIILE